MPWFTIPTSTYQTKTAIVIGAGLAGTSTAGSLAKRGWDVTIIEKSKIAGEASGNPVGIVAPLITHASDPIGQFYLHGFEYTLPLLENVSGIIDLSKSKKNCIPEGYLRQVNSEEASELSGIRLKSPAVYIEKAGLANPVQVCQNNISPYPVRIISANITSLQKTADGWAALENSREIATAPVMIIANAKDAGTFSECNFIPFQAVRGQLTYLAEGQLPLAKTICYEGGYATPALNGFNYIGATYNRNNSSYEISLDEHKENINNLQKIVDINVDYTKLHGRISFRAFVPDRRPVIGPIPDIAAFHNDYADLKHGRKKEYPPGKYLPGLYISAAHGSRGLTSCPIAGELLAAMINNEELPLAKELVDILNPARFVVRRLKGQ